MSSNITELLAAILSAKYGEEVRGSIHDAIEMCYADGKAGVNDLEARRLIEAVAAVNESQEADIEALTARVEELEQGEGGGGSEESTSIDIDTLIFDHGQVNQVQVNNNQQATRHVTFAKPFTEVPTVALTWGKQTGGASAYARITACILYETLSKTGFDFFISNTSGAVRSPTVTWCAWQPTTKTIDLDITIPDAQGMSEAEVREITSPIAASVDAIKTGYDGTVYTTPGEAVRTQINDLHVLIGDTPGTAIQASAIAYNNSNVAAELTNVNGRLGDLGLLETETKTDLVSAINEAAQSSAPSAVTCTVDGNGDATFALGEEDLSDIEALVGGTA